VNPSKVISIVAVLNSDPPTVAIEVLCSLCDEVEVLELNLDKLGSLSWLRRSDFYFVCGRHRKWASN